MSDYADLHVWKHDKHVGVLSLNETSAGKKYSFTYDDDLKSTDAVSLTMPVTKKVWEHYNLHPIFDMNLPEGHRRLKLQKLAKLTNVDDFGLLRLTGIYQVGALRYTDNPRKCTPPNPAEMKMDTLLHGRSRDLFNELLVKSGERLGVSGVQPKAMAKLSDCNICNIVVLDDYIIKSYDEEYPYVTANEYFCLQAAERAGINVPEHKLSDDAGVLIVKRFDLEEEGKKKSFEEFASLMAISSNDKYKGSYEKASKVIADFVSPRNRKDAYIQFFKAMVLNVIIQNGDAHLKNFGLLYSRQNDIHLAPIYDIVSTTPYIRNDVPALTLAGKKIWCKPKLLENFGRASCGLSKDEVKQCVAEVAKGVGSVLDDLYEYADKPYFKETGECMVEAWCQGLETFGYEPEPGKINRPCLKQNVRQTGPGI